MRAKLRRKPTEEKKEQVGSSTSDARRSIVEALGEANRPLTLKEIHQALAERDVTAHGYGIEEDVQSLLSWNLLETAKDDRKYSLTESGQRFLSGIKALARG